MPTTNDVRVNSDGSLSVTSAAYSTSGSNVASSASIPSTSTTLPPVQAVNGISLGTGASVFASTSGGTNVLLSFKSLVPGPGASVVDNGTTIAIGLDYTPRSVSLTGNADVGVSGHSDSANDFYQLKLLPTGVSAGTYTAASITVDANGRIVSAAATDVGERNDGQNLGANSAIYAGKSGTHLSFRTIGVTGGLTIQQTATDLILGTAGLGTVSAVNIQPGTGMTVSGGPVTTVGTMTVGLANSGVTAGVYNNPQLTIDATGRVLKASSMPAPADVQCANIGDGDGYLYAQKVNNVLQFRGLKAGPAISIAETGTLVTLDLVPTNVAGTYTYPVLTLDNYGRVTSAQQGFVPVATVSFTGTADIAVTAVQTASAIALTAALTPTNVTSGLYGSAVSVPSLTIDPNGRITGAASNPIPLGTTTTAGLLQINATTSSTSTTQAAAPYAVKVTYDLAASKLDAAGTAVAAQKLATARAIALKGDLVGSSSFDGSADIALAVSLPNTGVAAGYYVNPALTVDAKGRITAIANGMAPGTAGSGTVTSVGITSTSSITATGGPVTTSGAIRVDLTTTGVVPGTYTNATVSIDAQGRITAAANGAAPSGGSDGSGTSVPASNVYSFRLNYGADGSISAANVPSGWTVGVQGSQVIITHNLGIGVVPSLVCTYGFGSAAFPNSLVQRIPAGGSTATYSFASTNNQFVLYSATPTNTSSSNGNYAIVKITI